MRAGNKFEPPAVATLPPENPTACHTTPGPTCQGHVGHSGVKQSGGAGLEEDETTLNWLDRVSLEISFLFGGEVSPEAQVVLTLLEG